MKNNELWFTLLSGSVSGALILGITRRMVIAIFSLIAGNLLNLSLGGILQAIFLGIIIGSIGGILLFIVKNLLQINRFNTAILTGFILFIVSQFLAVVSGKFVLDISYTQFSTLIIVVMMFLLFGVFTAGLLYRFTGNRKSYS